MKFAKRSYAGLFCLFGVMLASSLPAQETPVALDVDTAASVSVNPDCNGTSFNLEPRTNALPQNTESVDFLPNRVGPGVDLVVGAGNDQRASLGGFDAYYVHLEGSNCGVDFEGTLSSSEERRVGKECRSRW